MENQHSALAYSPSWIDRFSDWVEKLPGPWWLFYVVLALALVLFQSGLQWQAGTYPIGSFDLFHVWFMVVIPYFLALLHYLNKSAEAALKTARPSLNVNDAEYADLRYRLTHLPARPTFVASLIAALSIIAAILLLGGEPESLGFSSAPISKTFLLFIWAVMWWIFGALFYQIAHQMRLIRRIYITHARVNLFQLTPLYAFSGVTARLAIGLTFQNYLWQVTYPQQANAGMNIGIGSFFALVAIVVFVSPLWGLHQRLGAEKVRALNENGQHFETATAALHRDVDAGNLENSTRLKDALTGLEIERNLLQKIPTWPWQPETLRGLITALLLPVVAFLIQFVLQRLLGK